MIATMEVWKLKLFVHMCVLCAVFECLQLKEEELICLVEECLVLAVFIQDLAVQKISYDLLGTLYKQTHQIKKAIECYKKQLRIADLISEEYAAYENLGNSNLQIGNLNEAVKYHKKCVSIVKEIGFKEGEAVAYSNLGNDYQLLGKYDEAITCHKRSLTIAMEIKNKSIEGKAYGNLGNAYHSLGKYQDATEFQEKALDIAIKLSDKAEEANAYGNLGNIYQSLGNYQKVIECLKKTLAIVEKIGDRKMEASAYLNLGNAYQSLGEYQKANEYHNKCLGIALEMKNRQLEGSVYGSIGNTYHSQGEYRQAITYHEKSLNIAVQIKDRNSEANGYGNLGNAYQSLGNNNMAKKYYEKQLTITVDIRDKKGQGHVYANLGGVYCYMGKYLKAIEYLEKSLEIATEFNDEQGKADTYGSLANTYLNLGRYNMGKKYCKKRLCIAKETGDKAGEGSSYGVLGNIHKLFHEYQQAIEYHKKALAIAEEIGDRNGKERAYGNIGDIFHLLGKYHEATEYHQKCLCIAKEIGDRKVEGKAYGCIGNDYRFLGRYQEAIEYCNRFLSISEEIEDRDGKGHAHYQIGRCYQSLAMKQDSDQSACMGEAESHLKKSIQSFESLFDDLEENDQHKISFGDTFIEAYRKLVNIYVQTQRTDEALLVSDRGRARALRDLLTLKYNMKKETTSESSSIEATDIEKIFSTCSFDILFYALLQDDLEANIWVLSHQRSFFYNESLNSSIKHSTISKNNSAEKLDEESVVNLVKSTYDTLNVRGGMQCEDRSLGLPEVEDQDDPVSSHVTKQTKAKEGEEVQEDNRSRCIYDDDEDADENPFEVLYDTLIAPLQHKLVQEEIVIIPEGALYMLPFAAFHDRKTGQFLSETKRIRLAPSLTTLKVLQESSNDQHYKSGALIIGNPEIGKVKYEGIERSFSNLPGAEDEAKEIAKLLGVEPLTRKQATKEVVIKKLQVGVSVIHFAAHGSENGQIILAPSRPPVLNSIPGEQDFILTTKEAQESGIRAQLVVLSCCHSGRGEIKSEGVVGMSRTFLAAGARAVVASLWAIDDSATKEFMLKFYSHLKRGESASKSLQQTMKEMRETERYKEPRYWAGFFLIGDDVTISV